MCACVRVHVCVCICLPVNSRMYMNAHLGSAAGLSLPASIFEVCAVYLSAASRRRATVGAMEGSGGGVSGVSGSKGQECLVVAVSLTGIGTICVCMYVCM